LNVIEELGSFAGMLFGARAARYGRLERELAQVRTIIDESLFHPVFQPVVDLQSGMTVGYEALTRFDDGTRPDLKFAAAHEVGLGSELESACARAALDAARALPPEAWLSVNFSPSTVIDGTVVGIIAGSPRMIVLEITEHIEIESYPALRRAIDRCAPARLAVDDAGAGFASLRHILELEPDIVKLDIGLVRNIDHDAARQALVAGLCHFSSRTGTVLVAEGIERAAEVAVLRELGVDYGQGYLLGRPQPIGALVGDAMDAESGGVPEFDRTLVPAKLRRRGRKSAEVCDVAAVCHPGVKAMFADR
jgi:EAL domain-containing protein (putative c-di-GMP-specific phosphodiesterase class I)